MSIVQEAHLQNASGDRATLVAKARVALDRRARLVRELEHVDSLLEELERGKDVFVPNQGE